MMNNRTLERSHVLPDKPRYIILTSLLVVIGLILSGCAGPADITSFTVSPPDIICPGEEVTLDMTFTNYKGFQLSENGTVIDETNIHHPGPNRYVYNIPSRTISIMRTPTVNTTWRLEVTSSYNWGRDTCCPLFTYSTDPRWINDFETASKRVVQNTVEYSHYFDGGYCSPDGQVGYRPVHAGRPPGSTITDRLRVAAITVNPYPQITGGMLTYSDRDQTITVPFTPGREQYEFDGMYATGTLTIMPELTAESLAACLQPIPPCPEPNTGQVLCTYVRPPGSPPLQIRALVKYYCVSE